MRHRSGFTLIETLIVIGIIGIITSFMLVNSGDVRSRGRDDRRIADLKQVQQALEVFKQKCGFYPGSFDPVTSACLGGVSSAQNQNPSSWIDLATILDDARIGVGNIPFDPLPSHTYAYFVQLGSGSTPKAQCYVLSAKLETKHQNLDREDLDNTDIVDKLAPLGSGIDGKNLHPAAPDCDDTDNTYCIGNIECFHGL